MHHAYATCTQFNFAGTLLAVGYANGLVVIWDFIYRKIARTIKHHCYPISCIEWGKDRKLMIASYDRCLSIWDAISETLISSVTLSDTPLSLCLNEQRENVVLVNFLNSPSILFDTLANSEKRISCIQDDNNQGDNNNNDEVNDL